MTTSFDHYLNNALTNDIPMEDALVLAQDAVKFEQETNLQDAALDVINEGVDRTSTEGQTRMTAIATFYGVSLIDIGNRTAQIERESNHLYA